MNGLAQMQLTTRTGPKDIKHREITWQAREKIKSTRIVNRLQKHIDAKKDSEHLMNDAQVKAALGLLKKVVPDLNATHIHRTGDFGDARNKEEVKRYIAEIFGQIIDITPNPLVLPQPERVEAEALTSRSRPPQVDPRKR